METKLPPLPVSFNYDKISLLSIQLSARSEMNPDTEFDNALAAQAYRTLQG
jgi:hypothetical protein